MSERYYVLLIIMISTFVGGVAGYKIANLPTYPLCVVEPEIPK